MDKTIETVRLMAEGKHPGVIGENAREELGKVARLLGECRDAMGKYVKTAESSGLDEKGIYYTWFKELLA